MSLTLRIAGWMIARRIAKQFPHEDATEVHLTALCFLYASDIAERLERIYAVDADRDRFIAISLKGRRYSYVQAMFVDDDRRLLMEAASGFYAQAEGAPRAFRVPDKGLAALAALGFSTDDSEGNFQYLHELGEEPGEQAFGSAAGILLKALVRAYNVRARDGIEIIAPFAPDRDDDLARRARRKFGDDVDWIFR